MSLGPKPPPEVDIGLHSHWKPSAVAFVAAVCILALILSYCRILRPFVFSPIPRGHVQRARLNDDNFQDHSLRFHSHGLDDSIMHTLPISQFKKKEEESGVGGDGKECAICLGEFGEGDWMKHLPNCTHVFHIACIDTWFQAHSNCPLCRTDVRAVSGHSFLETLRRENFSPDGAAHYQILRSEVLSAYRPEERGAGHVAPL